MFRGIFLFSSLKNSKLPQNKLRSTQNVKEEAIFKINLKDKINLKMIKDKFRYNLNILFFVGRLKWDWAGYLGRLKGKCRTKKIKRQLTKCQVGDDFHNFIKVIDPLEKISRSKQFHCITTDRTKWERSREAFAKNRAKK